MLQTEGRKQITSSVRCFEEFISPDKEKQGREHIQAWIKMIKLWGFWLNFEKFMFVCM